MFALTARKLALKQAEPEAGLLVGRSHGCIKCRHKLLMPITPSWSRDFLKKD
jgi:hypothetical protein